MVSSLAMRCLIVIVGRVSYVVCVQLLPREIDRPPSIVNLRPLKDIEIRGSVSVVLGALVPDRIGAFLSHITERHRWRDLRGLRRGPFTHIAIVNLLSWRDRQWGRTDYFPPPVHLRFMGSSAFQTGCDIGRLASPKYQTANHVTSHT